MNPLTKNIPNIITFANLICGLFSIIFAFQGDLKMASLCVFAGAFFDFFDGLAARHFNLISQFGKQLDSMADMVTFAVAPSFILFNFIFYINNNILFRHSTESNNFFLAALLAFLTSIFSAYRLANFNIDNKQSISFTGLPTPALGIFIAAIPLINFNQFPIFSDIKFLTLSALIMPILLVLNIPLFSLKFSITEKINSRINILRLSLILTAIILFFIFKFAAIPFIIILYIILSILNNLL